MRIRTLCPKLSDLKKCCKPSVGHFSALDEMVLPFLSILKMSWEDLNVNRVLRPLLRSVTTK